MRLATIEPELVTDIRPSGPDWTEVVPQWVPAFFGDTDSELKHVQRATYSSLAYELCSRAKRRYHDACDLLGVQTALAERLAEVVLPPMPFLPRMYRKTAAAFRYRSRQPRRVSGGDVEELRLAWEVFYLSEVEDLVADDESARLVIEAVVESGERAQAVDDVLVGWLGRRYGDFTLRGSASAGLPAAGSQVRPNPPD